MKRKLNQSFKTDVKTARRELRELLKQISENKEAITQLNRENTGLNRQNFLSILERNRINSLEQLIGVIDAMDLESIEIQPHQKNRTWTQKFIRNSANSASAFKGNYEMSKFKPWHSS